MNKKSDELDFRENWLTVLVGVPLLLALFAAGIWILGAAILLIAWLGNEILIPLGMKDYRLQYADEYVLPFVLGGITAAIGLGAAFLVFWRREKARIVTESHETKSLQVSPRVALEEIENQTTSTSASLVCDFCGTPITDSEMHCHSAAGIVEKTAHGFSPDRLPQNVEELLIATGISRSEWWQNIVRDNSEEDWGLCHACNAEFLNFDPEAIEAANQLEFVDEVWRKLWDKYGDSEFGTEDVINLGNTSHDANQILVTLKEHGRLRTTGLRRFVLTQPPDDYLKEMAALHRQS